MTYRCATALLVALASVSCRGRARATPLDGDVVTVSTADASVSASEPAPRPHCSSATEVPVVLGLATAELGDAVVVGAGLGLGLVAVDQGKRTAAVVRVEGPNARRIDLGVISREAPPPQPLVFGDELYAVGYVAAPGPTSRNETRSLSVHRVGAGPAERLVDLPAERDTSAAFDVAAPMSGGTGPVVAWDDLGPQGQPELVIVILAPNLRAVQARRVVLPTDAGAAALTDPRVTARLGGYWLTWIVRKKEPQDAGATGANAIETPSEQPTLGWVEGVMLDAMGAPEGAPRRLSRALGHVASYAALAVGEALVIVAVDEDVGARGAAVDEIVWRGDTVSPPTGLVASGVEAETAVTLVSRGAVEMWVSFVGAGGETEMLSLAPIAAGPHTRSITAPTVEPLLSGSRVLASMDGRLAIAKEEAGWRVRWASCVW